MFNVLPLVSGGFRAILYVSPLYVCLVSSVKLCNQMADFHKYRESVMPLESYSLISYTMEDKTTIEERLPSVQQSQSHAATTSSQSSSPSSCTAHLGGSCRNIQSLLPITAREEQCRYFCKIFITTSLLGWRNRPLRNLCHHTHTHTHTHKKKKTDKHNCLGYTQWDSHQQSVRWPSTPIGCKEKQRLVQVNIT